MNAKHANATIQTYQHVKLVGKFLFIFIKDLLDRAANHDNTKFESPEVEIFGENTELLAKCEYGSPEYQVCLDKVRPAINHHYSKNRHHPEFHKNGVDDMTLPDLIEMLSDWKAATERNKDGNIRKSIDINAKRYNLSPQLKSILENTVQEYFD